jgi:hypothetical protein
MQPHPISFDFPLPRTHTGLPLGNGAFGALAWSKSPDTLNLTVSRNDFWDRRHGGILPEGATYERVKEAYATGDPQAMKNVLSPNAAELWKSGARPSTLLPVGRFEFRLRKGLDLESGTVDCARGRLVINVKGTSAVLELVMGTLSDVLWLRDPAGLIADVACRPAWEWCEEEFVRRGFAAPEMIDGGWVQTCPADPALCVLSRKRDDGFGITLCLGEDAEASQRKADVLLNDFNGEGMLAEVDSWWAEYWKWTPDIEIPDAFWSDFLVYAHYKWGCATNPNAPRPCPLQGPWIEEYQFPPWGGDYTINVNIEQIYTFAFCGGNTDHALRLFDMLESPAYRETMQHNAKTLLGIDDGLLLSHSINDEGRQCQLGFSPHSALDQAVTAWMAHIYWLYFDYTGDHDFLRDRALPFMRGVMRVYEAMLEERGDGTLWLPVSVSPEYGVSATMFEAPRQDGPNSSMQLTCIHMLIGHLLDACRELDIEPDPAWLEIRKRTPRFCTVEGPDGRERIGIWEGQDLAVCHRHHSHLGSIYPFDILHEMDETEREKIDNGIEHWLHMGMGAWSEWCYPWAAMIEARMGMVEAPLVLLNIWRSVFINESMTTVYLPRFHGVSGHRYKDIDVPREKNEIMQFEGTAAGATAIVEMLVHTQGGVTKIFPATPAAWKDVKFGGLPQPGGLQVYAERKDGRTAWVVARANRAGTFTFAVPDWSQAELRTDTGDRQVELPLRLELKAGELVSLWHLPESLDA